MVLWPFPFPPSIPPLAPPSSPRRWRRRLVRTLFVAVGLLVVAALVVVAVYRSSFGAAPKGERLARMQQSPHYRDGRLTQPLTADLSASFFEVIRGGLFAPRDGRTPTAPTPTVRPTLADTASAAVRATWLGHSTVLLELDGKRFLTDPAIGPYASPGRLFGVKRFFESPIPVAELPPLDAVIFSHDHYDHLDASVVRELAARTPRFVVPLGVGAHLEAWGVAPEKITELDWWEETTVGTVTVAATPARHSSGRFLNDKDRTFWAGWAFLGANERVFYSGDSGFGPHFAEIGERLGPFDLAMIEIGGYNALWANVHMGPEQALAAYRLVYGRTLLPLHWATFDLAPHGWTEPIERLRVAQDSAERIAYPRPGETITLRDPLPTAAWWPSQPWKTAEQAPVVSSGVPDSLRATPVWKE